MDVMKRWVVAALAVVAALLAATAPAQAKLPAGARGVELAEFLVFLSGGALAGVGLAPWVALGLAARRQRHGVIGPPCGEALAASILGALVAVASSVVVLLVYVALGNMLPEVAAACYTVPALASVLSVLWADSRVARRRGRQ
jgi:hypothetical protein